MTKSQDEAAWLTALELRVLVLMSEGLTTDEIARRLGHSRDAVRDDVAGILRKLERIRRAHFASRVQGVHIEGGEGEPSRS
ncbi:MAG: helix-turn-helix transcriptional regulator [Chloroflexi bacterium]|nr:helix-turn-helix transcriptional regulator [Chloroflexota bacterium]